MAGDLRRLNVAFVTPWYPSAGHLYAGTFVLEHAAAVRLGHNVVVIHAEPGSAADGVRRPWNLVREDDGELLRGIPTYRLRFHGVLGRRGAFAGQVCALWDSLRRIERMHGRFDLLHAHVYTCAIHAVVLGKLRRTPTVVTEHSSDFLARRLGRAGRLKARIAFGLADRVLPVSEVLRAAIEAYGVRARFRVVPNAVDARLFAPSSRCPAAHEVPRLLYVGNLIDAKGLPILVDAMARLRAAERGAHLDVVGSGPELEDYQSATAASGLADSVTFHGPKTKREIAALLREADLFVLPSLCETFSVATAEAMMAGVPALVTRCGGPELLVSDSEGMVVPPNDAEALASGIGEMLERLGSYDRTGIARRAEQRFGYQAVAAQLDAVYSEVLGR